MEKGCCISRCFCIHSQLQLVDLTMSAVMVHHGVISQPLVTVAQPPPQGLVRTMSTIKSVQSELREAFRSRHRRRISEVVLAVGQSPFRPQHTYRIPVNICEHEDSTSDACGSECEELRKEESRRVNLFLFKNFPPGCVSQPRGLRIFVFLRAADSLCSENVKESDFDIPIERCTVVSYSHTTCISSPAQPLGEHRWMRLVPFVVPEAL